MQKFWWLLQIIRVSDLSRSHLPALSLWLDWFGMAKKVEKLISFWRNKWENFFPQAWDENSKKLHKAPANKDTARVIDS